MSEKIVRIDGEDGKRTYETPNGELQSVTTFEQLLAKPFLVPWAARLSAEFFRDKIELIKSGELNLATMDLDDIVRQAKEYHKQKQSEAKEYGSVVHKYITEFFAFGQLPEDPVLNKLVISAISRITGELRLTVRDTEKMVYYKNLYAGTLDLIGAGTPVGYETEKNVIVDIKTGRGRVYEEAFIQVSAYALAEEWMTSRKIDLAVILPLNKDTGESDDLKILNRRVWLKYAKAFLALVAFDGKLKKARKKK